MTKDNIKTGQRLQECIDIKKMKRSTLIEKIKKLPNGETITRQNLYAYIKGTPISEHRLELISKALNIYPGYLLGDDGFKCATYTEYLDFKKLMGNPDFVKYDNLFKHANLLLSAEINVLHEDEVIFRLFNKDISKTFSEKDMINFYSKTCIKIKELFKDYDSLDNPPAGGTCDEWTHFLIWHPDFPDDPENKYYLSEPGYKKAIDLWKGGDADDLT